MVNAHQHRTFQTAHDTHRWLVWASVYDRRETPGAIAADEGVKEASDGQCDESGGVSAAAGA
jgi:hypothetical protein